MNRCDLAEIVRRTLEDGAKHSILRTQTEQGKLVTTLLLDANVYDKLQADGESRTTLRSLVDRGLAKVIATPMVLEELQRSPFGGIPNWFNAGVEAENVTVLGYATLDITNLGEGEIYGQHRGQSGKIPDAIIADSADALADVLVSEDRRCRERLKKISTHCTALNYDQFREWLRVQSDP
jgi:predicted nucleic acid-binding protein